MQYVLLKKSVMGKVVSQAEAMKMKAAADLCASAVPVQGR